MMALGLLIVVAVVAGVALLPRREVQHPGVALLRVLVPSWRFFDAVGSSPLLLARTGPTPDTLGAWQIVIQPPPRAFWHLVWNPQGNLSLAYHTAVERLASEVDLAPTARDLTNSVSYQLVLNLVETTLRSTAGAQREHAVQFKLVERGIDGAAAEIAVMISDVHTR
ncbi:MAG: hypothetical protein U0132_18060 [Gemmatimonadaceae bacterium]